MPIHANAESYSFDFGTLLSPTPGFQPSETFAHLSVSTTDQRVYSFTLTAGDLNSIFGNGAFISEAIFNTSTGKDPRWTSIIGSDNGVSDVDFIAHAPHVGSVNFDFGDRIGGGHDGRLTDGEEVSWTATFKTRDTPQPDPFFLAPDVALHVQGFSQALPGFSRSSYEEWCNENVVTSGWYTPTVAAIPEPETYAMLLAGLGLMGLIIRRRAGIEHLIRRMS